MSKHLISLLLLAFMAVPAWSQEAQPDEATTGAEEAAAAEVAESAAPVDVDDDDLDLQTYEEDEDDFVPTEEIPADEPIPFPSNI
jgi:glucose dehydrogenase